MAHVVIIPARFAATRFPGKLLADAGGWPLIRHAYERVRSARGIDRVIVAADGALIANAVRDFGGEVELTDPNLASGTDRVAAAVRSLRLDPERDLIANVQADEPEIEPAHVELLFELLESAARAGDCSVATLAARRFGPDGFDDPNRVKVVVDASGSALYFSRAGIPHPREGISASFPWLYHVGVYGFRPGALRRFAETAPSSLERIECLEQLRFLANGEAIRVGVVERAAPGIDTPRDLERFLGELRANGFRPR
ncbi:MAG: 3-deoxy-manno-octulosonate cytidylyltransferase [Planctomycetes bacterium]|nr:3-deoxy-manno-octulosonate cytidylyltransferase [Planctomycetota bacterium]